MTTKTSPAGSSTANAGSSASATQSPSTRPRFPSGFDNSCPGAGYLISIGLEPINPSRAGWAFLNRVITALATGSHGLGFDVFTDEPIH
jgi:hypothetical protein